MAEARAALRHLVRAVDRHLTSKYGNTMWRAAVFDEFRRHASEADSSKVMQGLQDCRDIAFYLDSVPAHKELLFSYNIGVDRQKRQRQKLEESANRVGVSLPQWQ